MCYESHFNSTLSIDDEFTCNYVLSTLAAYEEGTFDVILSGVVSPVCLSHNTDLLAEYARILKPSGLVVIREPVVDQGTTELVCVLCFGGNKCISLCIA